MFRIREAVEADLSSVNALSSAEGMGDVLVSDLVLVAVNPEDEVVGFIRLVFDEEGVCHVNPVVVHLTWRRYGVGKALIDTAAERYGELRLVSRGSSLAFYEALGFEPIAWDMIFGQIIEECDGCEMIEECQPTPVRRRHRA